MRRWQWLAVLVLLAVCTGIVSATTVTLYPETAAEGALRQSYSAGSGQPWATIRGASGNGILTDYSTAAYIGVRIQADSTSSNYRDMRRYGICVDTSSIPDDATVTGFIVSLFSGGANNTYATSPYLTLMEFSPSVRTLLANADYSKSGIWTGSNNITFSTWATPGRMNFTISNFSIINKTGDTCLMMRHSNDIENVPATWGSVISDNAYTYDISYADASRHPFYTITYDEPPVASFSKNAADGIAPAAIQFTDTSTNTPTSWAWDFGDGNTSEDQNPVHTFAFPGTFDVSLTAENAAGTDTETSSITIYSTTNYSVVQLGDPQTLTETYPETLNITFSYLESLKNQYNIKAIIVMGDLVDNYDSATQWNTYLAAKTRTTIPIYEIAGNHDVNASSYDYTYWDTYIGASQRKLTTPYLNQSLQDFVLIRPPYVYNYQTLTPEQFSDIGATIDANPTKFPLIAWHAWFDDDLNRYPVAADFISNVSPSKALILSGHQNQDNGNKTVVTGAVIESLMDVQGSNISTVKIWIVNAEGGTVKKIWQKDAYIAPSISFGTDYLVYDAPPVAIPYHPAVQKKNTDIAADIINSIPQPWGFILVGLFLFILVKK